MSHPNTSQARDVANPSVVGMRTIKPSVTGIQSGAQYTPRPQRGAKFSTVQGAKYAGKHAVAAAQVAKDAARVATGFKAAQGTVDALKKMQDEGIEVPAELLALAQQVMQVATKALAVMAERAEGVLRDVRDDIAAENLSTEEMGGSGATGEIPAANAQAGALDTAALDKALAKKRAVLDARHQTALDLGIVNQARRAWGMDIVTDDDPIGSLQKLFEAEAEIARERRLRGGK